MLSAGNPSGETSTAAILADLADGAEVVVVSHGFQSNYERGFCNGLASNAVRVTLISSDATDYAGLQTQVRTTNLRGSQDANRTRLKKLFNQIRYHVRLMAFVLRCRRKIVHVIGLTQPPLLHGVIEGLWFRLFAGRYVLTIHNLLPHDKHLRRTWWLYWLSYRMPQRLVVHTSRMRDELRERFAVDPARVVVMEHGIEPLDEECIADVDCHAMQRELRVLFFGIVARYKGLDLLLDAVRLLPQDIQVHIAIVGVCKDSVLATEINAIIETHPRKTFISWQNNYVPEAGVANIFRSADVIVLPYRHIDQSGVLFQALRFGLPVIATPVGDFSRYVSAEVGEMADSSDGLGIADAIKRFAANRSQFSRIRIAQLGQSFEWPVTVRTLKVAYV